MSMGFSVKYLTVVTAVHTHGKRRQTGMADIVNMLGKTWCTRLAKISAKKSVPTNTVHANKSGLLVLLALFFFKKIRAWDI